MMGLGWIWMDEWGGGMLLWSWRVTGGQEGVENAGMRFSGMEERGGGRGLAV